MAETPFPKYTKVFSQDIPCDSYPSEDCLWDSKNPDWELSQTSLIGIIVGGGATLIFFIFAIINIIIDEVQRHADFKN